MYAVLVYDSRGEPHIAELHTHKVVAQACLKDYEHWQAAQVVGPWQSVMLEDMPKRYSPHFG